MKNQSRSVTLIELVIVLIILLALAGIGITFYPNLAPRANLVGALTTLNELNNNFQLIEIMAEGGMTDTGAMPDDLDILTDIVNVAPLAGPPAIPGSGIRSMVLADFFGGTAVVASDPTEISLDDIADLVDDDDTGTPTDLITTATVVAAFAARGVNSFAQTTPVAPFNVTFDYSGAFTDTAGLTGSPPGTVFYALNAAAAAKLGISDFVGDPDVTAIPTGTPTPVFIVLGVGASARHIGEAPGLMEAPVYISEVAAPPTLITGSPTGITTPLGILETDIRDYYSRFMVIYKISAASTGSTSTVNIDFVKCVCPHPLDGLISGDQLLTKIYSLLD